jgi:hypothetical protein
MFVLDFRRAGYRITPTVMKINKNSLHQNTIKILRPDAQDIHAPPIRGSNQVFIADTTDGKLVFKLTTGKIARRNEQIGAALNRPSLPLPAPAAASCGAHHFETYPYISGKTLFQRCHEGLEAAKFNKIYEETINLTHNLSSVATSDFAHIELRYFHDITRENMARTIAPPVCSIVSNAVRFMNSGEQGVYHFGLTPKNILLDDNDHLAAVLDLDEVAIGNENFMFGIMLEGYKRFGGKSAYLFDAYKSITNGNLDRTRVNTQANTIAVAKKLLYQLSQITKNPR